MTLSRLVALLLATGAVAMTLVPLLRAKSGLVRLFDFPRLQIAVVAFVALAALLASPASEPDPTGFAIGAAALAAMLWQAVQISPYVPLVGKPSPAAGSRHPERELTLLVANVHLENSRVEPLAGLIAERDPDIVLLLETDVRWLDRLEPVTARYPVRASEPRDDHYGIHVMTRLDCHAIEIRRLVAPDVPSVKARVATASGYAVDLYGLHPRPPLPEQSSRQRDVELLLVADEVRESGRPAIVCGDLNDVAWSRTTQRFLAISGMIDPRVGRGLYATFHADYWFARWPLDHVFYTPDLRLVSVEVLPHIGSDHFPILVRLQAPR